MKLKKEIIVSNLAMRFYAHDGWTKPELDALCTVGQVVCNFPHDKYPYLTLDHKTGSRFNCKKLAEIGMISNRNEFHSTLNYLTDLEYMEHMQQ